MREVEKSKMRVAIWGTGDAGQHLACELTRVGGYEIDAFINAKPDIDQIDGIPVRQADEYIESCDPDAYMIAAGHQRSVFDMITRLRGENINEIYFLQDIAGKNRLRLFFDDGRVNDRLLRKLRFAGDKPLLPYFEIPIVDDCNLNCKGCVFGCNSKTENKCIPVSQIDKDLHRIKELFSDLLWIRILGGEPLLHPDIQVVIELFREIFPDTEVDLCTNGLLLNSMPEGVFKTLRNLQITVHVSGYPPVMKMKDRITGRLNEYGIRHTYIERNEFFKFYREKEIEDVAGNHANCPTRGCPELYYGNLLKCSAVIAFERFNEQFGTHFEIENTDRVSIHDPDVTGDKIIDFLKKPARLCRYCDTGNSQRFAWEPGIITPELVDYVIG